MKYIDLKLRYPDSKIEDITDAHMSGFVEGVETARKIDQKRLERRLYSEVLINRGILWLTYGLVYRAIHEDDVLWWCIFVYSTLIMIHAAFVGMRQS